MFASKWGIGTLLGVLILVWAAAASAEIVDRIAVMVNDKPILLSEIRDQAHQILRDRGGDGERDLADAMKEAEKLLIERKLIQIEAERRRVKVSDQDMEKIIQGIAEQNKVTIEQLKTSVVEQGMPWNEFVESLRNRKLEKNLVSHAVTRTVYVDDEEIRRDYRANIEKFPAGDEEVRVLLIFMPKTGNPRKDAEVRAQVEEVLKKAHAGEDFEALARAHSQTDTAEEGGDIGFVKRGQTLPAFENAAFGLPIGAVSDLLETEQGFGIIKVAERRGGGYKPFSEVKEEIHKRLAEEKYQENYQKWIDALKGRAVIEKKL